MKNAPVRVRFSLKPLCIAAAAAKLHDRFFFGETVVNVGCQGIGKNGFHILPEQIAKGKIPLMIQAAGDYRAITEHTNLIPQTVAEASFATIGGG